MTSTTAILPDRRHPDGSAARGLAKIKTCRDIAKGSAVADENGMPPPGAARRKDIEEKNLFGGVGLLVNRVRSRLGEPVAPHKVMQVIPLPRQRQCGTRPSWIDTGARWSKMSP
jgi:hypothetical protein